MPWHDFYCARCGYVQPNVVIPAAIGAQAGAPRHCDQLMTWIPGIGRMDVGAVKGASFQAFETTDGRGQRVLIDSLHKLRQVEREAEQAYRNGEGQPMIFRRWAQDQSNQDQPTLSKSYDGSEQPTEAAKHRFGSTKQTYGTADPRDVEHATALQDQLDADRGFGPGVDESNASALGMEGGKP
jgi:hypothetical protein